MTNFREQRLLSRPLVRARRRADADPAIQPVRPEARAILVPAIAVMIADRVIDEEELNELTSIIDGNLYFSDVSGSDLRWIFDTVQRDILERGEDAVFIDAARDLAPDHYRLAFLFAFSVAGADGSFDNDEVRCIARAARHFGLSEDTVTEIAAEALEQIDV